MEGILPLYKPRGLTSHDCVFKLRKILGVKKVGHTGTLDPQVDGVLPICIGKATKVAEYIQDAGKEYEGEITIGISTETEDATGGIVEKTPVKTPIRKEEIKRALANLTGEIVQIPPMYSAVKVKGKKLYEYARKGIEVERPKRKVYIYSFELLDEKDLYSGETVSFRFRTACSKGTYIRTLAVMVGEELGYPAHMSKLTRTRAAGFTLDDCVTFEEVEQSVADGTIGQKLHPLESAISHLPKCKLSDKLIEKVKNGAVLPLPEEWKQLSGPLVILSERGLAIAIYKRHPEKHWLMKPEKVLRNMQE